MLGIVDRVAEAHALHSSLPTETCLRHYGLGDTVGSHGEEDVFVLPHQGASLPTIIVQGSVGEAGEVWQITREIRKALKQKVTGVEFESQHAY